MVESQEIRDAFSARLNHALDNKDGVRKGRGRNVDLCDGVRPYLAKSASTQATNKWLNAESMPDRAKMLAIAEWLGVRVEWLQYGEGEPHATAAAAAAGAVGARAGGEQGGGVAEAPAAERMRVREFEIDIPQYDVRAAMGAGQVPPDYVELVRHVVVDKRHLDLFGVSYSAQGNLAMITGWGQSMEPTINHGEPVIVDRGIDRFIGDGLYVFTWNDMIYLKRLQQESKRQIKVISDNRCHDPFYVPVDETIIHARVVMVWNARKV